VIQEQSIGIHYNAAADVDDYIDGDDPFDYEDGYVDTLDEPGLGVSIDEDAVVAAAGEVDWHSPVWRHDDGSVAEW
jgi:galactonate dehydratase